MRNFLLLAAIICGPLSAHADCAAEFAKLRPEAKPEESAKLNSPRAKALFDKTTKLIAQHNEKDCADTIKGLHQLMGRSE